MEDNKEINKLTETKLKEFKNKILKTKNQKIKNKSNIKEINLA